MKPSNIMKSILIFLVTLGVIQVSAQQQDVKIGLEVDTAYSVLFGVPLDSIGPRMVWHPQKSSLLVGSPFAPEIWHIDSIGESSYSFGIGNSPYGLECMTWGTGNHVASENFNTTVFGLFNRAITGASQSFIGGMDNESRANRSFIYGANNVFSEGAFASVSLGTANNMNSSHGMSWGESNEVNASHSNALGRFNIVNGFNSTAIGTGLVTFGAFSTVVGVGNDTTLHQNLSSFEMNEYTPLFVVGNSTDFNSRSNALSVFASGFVKIGSDTALADLHIKQSASGDEVSSAGIRLESKEGSDYWQIYSSGTKLSFGRFGAQVAYIDEDGSYVDNTMLLREDDKKWPLAKSIASNKLNQLKIRSINSKNGSPKWRVDTDSVIKYAPEIIKYNSDGNAHAIDKEQLIIMMLARLIDQEKSLADQSRQIALLNAQITDIIKPD